MARLVSVLRQIHDDLDAAVAEAYGWPATLSDEELLTRPGGGREPSAPPKSAAAGPAGSDFQNAAGTATQTGLDTGPDDSTAPAAALPTIGKRPWPKALAEQAQAVRAQLAALGQARTLPDGTFVAQ